MRSALALATVLLAPALRADDEADAKALVERAIKARGDKPDAAPGTTTWKERIKLDLGGQDVEIDTEWTVQPPDKLRIQMTVEVSGQKIPLALVVNGEKVWFAVNGQLQEGDGAQLGEALVEMNRMWATSLAPLLTDDAFKLATAKDQAVNGKPAAGVTVRNGKRPVVTLYFDKQTGLLVKREALVRDQNADGKEVLEEMVLSDYKEADGRKFHTKAVVLRDGKPWYRSEVSAPRAVEKPDPKLFEKPEEK